MANINIFEIQETKLCTDLSGRFVLLYGAPKSGKTSTAALWPKPLLLAFEHGYNALVGVRPADIDSWQTFKNICRQLEKPEAKEIYKTIIVDTASIAYSLCEKFICARENVNAVGDIGYAKGWAMLKDEFSTTFRKLSQLGYAIVFIAHAKSRVTEFTDEDGNSIEAIAPDLPSAAYKVINELVDIIAYLAVEYDIRTGNAHRYLYTRGTPRIFAGSRYKYLSPKIELSYQNLVNAVADAMKKEANETNTELISEDEMPHSQIREFSDVMSELKGEWNRLVTAYGEEGKEKIKEISRNVFGHDVVLSKATEDQQELLEEVLDQLKHL